MGQRESGDLSRRCVSAFLVLIDSLRLRPLHLFIGLLARGLHGSIFLSRRHSLVSLNSDVGMDFPRPSVDHRSRIHFRLPAKSLHPHGCRKGIFHPGEFSVLSPLIHGLRVRPMLFQGLVNLRDGEDSCCLPASVPWCLVTGLDRPKQEKQSVK